jgi:hypothetical protein
MKKLLILLLLIGTSQQALSQKIYAYNGSVTSEDIAFKCVDTTISLVSPGSGTTVLTSWDISDFVSCHVLPADHNKNTTALTNTANVKIAINASSIAYYGGTKLDTYLGTDGLWQ